VALQPQNLATACVQNIVLSCVCWCLCKAVSLLPAARVLVPQQLSAVCRCHKGPAARGPAHLCEPVHTCIHVLARDLSMARTNSWSSRQQTRAVAAAAAAAAAVKLCAWQPSHCSAGLP